MTIIFNPMIIVPTVSYKWDNHSLWFNHTKTTVLILMKFCKKKGLYAWEWHSYVCFDIFLNFKMWRVLTSNPFSDVPTTGQNNTFGYLILMATTWSPFLIYGFRCSDVDGGGWRTRPRAEFGDGLVREACGWLTLSMLIIVKMIIESNQFNYVAEI